jgi:hypothetical protein
MKTMILRGAAIALFSCLMTIGGPAMARGPTIPCTPELQGTIVTTPTSTGYIEWYCGNGSWRFFLQWVCDSRGDCYPL